MEKHFGSLRGGYISQVFHIFPRKNILNYNLRYGDWISLDRLYGWGDTSGGKGGNRSRKQTGERDTRSWNAWFGWQLGGTATFNRTLGTKHTTNTNFRIGADTYGFISKSNLLRRINFLQDHALESWALTRDKLWDSNGTGIQTYLTF